MVLFQEMCKIEKVKRLVKQVEVKAMSIEKAVDAAIDEMPDDFEIKSFLLANREEVKAMFLAEYNMEREIGLLRRDTEITVREEVAKDMLKDGEPIPKIIKYSKLSEDAIRKLAKSIGVAVP